MYTHIHFTFTFTFTLTFTPTPHSQCDEVKVFVQSVNSVVRIQEETERVRDAMTRISDYVVMDNPPQKLKEVGPRCTTFL